jgi:hypothetical protein
VKGKAGISCRRLASSQPFFVLEVGGFVEIERQVGRGVVFLINATVAFLSLQAFLTAEEQVILLDRLPANLDSAPITPESILMANHVTPPFE